MSAIKKFAAISKVEDNEDGTITVFGVASTEAVDAHGEIVTKEAMQNALPGFFKYGGTGALRSMHQPIAAGVVTKATVNDAGETEIEATVVDANEIIKVKAGVYKGFSIGGKQVPGGYDKVTKTISALELTEISLVDRPANPESVISMWKAEVVTVAPEQADAVDALAEILNKGDVSPERLVELAQAEVLAKAEPAPVVDEPVVKVDEAAPIAKGMYGVSRFAELLQSIYYMVSDAKWEAESEGDNSTVPAALQQWLTDGAAVFQSMAAEEIAEMVAQYAPPPADDVVVVELSDQATTLRKSLDDAAGGGLAGYLSIAKAHMPEDDVARMVLADGYEKATTAVLARLAPDSDAIAKLADATATIGKLEAELSVLKDQPAPSKAVLRVVVEKGETAAPADTGPIKKADGSIDHEATAREQIKKMHESGGQLLRSFQP